uniref:cadherin-like domain-containing protein n=1 Tax=uncultured Tolumonas sp. TaxID=263765 RepID=UPI002A0A14BA
LTIAPATLLANDSDPDGDPLSITSVQAAVHGTVALVEGNIVFTPAADYHGPASFTYTISDGQGGSDTATVTIEVTPVNDNPHAVNDEPAAQSDALVTPEDTALTIAPATLLANDSDPDGDPLSITSVQGAVNGTVALVEGNIVFTPAADYHGPASFTYTISDGQGGSDTATVTIEVTPVNDNPHAVNDEPAAQSDALVTPEDTALTIAPATLLANDSDPDGDPLSITSVQGAVNGTVALVEGNIVFTPAADYHGPASFTYTISDGQGGSDTATVTIEVTPVNDNPDAVNDAPAAQSDALVTPEDTALTIAPATLLANDSDPDGDPLSITSVQAAVHGTVALVEGNIVFTPAADYHGPASFTYTISDGQGGSDTATVTIEVTPVNDNPHAVNDEPAAQSDALVTPEDTALTIAPATLLANDSDPDGDPLSITSVQAAVHGTVALVEGNIVFTPAADYHGPASFTYTISDGQGGSDTATVTIEVTPVNDNPHAVNDEPAAQSDALVTPEDTALTIAPATLLANDSDPDGDPLSITSVQGAVNGTVALVEGNIVFTPAADYHGPASFTYTISDGQGGSDTATVTIEVTPVNDNPHAVNDEPAAQSDALVTPEDTALTIAPATLLANDSDPDGDPLSITSVQGAVNGTVALVEGNIVFTPAADYHGPASFTYTISDGQGGSDTATVTIEVTPVNDNPDAVNDAPAAQSDALVTPEDTALTIAPATLLANDSDPDGDPLSITSVQAAVHGTVALVEGNIVFTPAADYHGPASFTYTISDGQGGSDTATVTIEVTPVNDNPHAVNDEPAAQSDALVTPEDTALTIAPATLLANDSDPDGDPLSITSVQGAVNGTVALVEGNIVFTPAADYHGPASFTYTISDGQGGSDTATVTIEVTPVNDNPHAVNDAPAAQSDALVTPEDTALTIAPATLLANDSDPDGDPLSITSVQAAVHGTVALVEGNIVFTPAADYHGPASFTYTISDGQGGSDTATVTIEVTPVNDNPHAVNDEPAAQSDALVTPEDTALTIAPATLLANDSDPDGDPLSITSVQGAVNGTVALVEGNIVFTPAADYHGPASFTYTISDGQGGSDTATVTIEVTPVNDNPHAVNDEPAAQSDALVTPEDTALTIATGHIVSQ